MCAYGRVWLWYRNGNNQQWQNYEGNALLVIPTPGKAIRFVIMGKMCFSLILHVYMHSQVFVRTWMSLCAFQGKKKKGFSTTLIIFVSVIIMEYSANILPSLVWSSDCLFSSHFGLGCSDDSDDNPTDLPYFFSLSPLHSFSLTLFVCLKTPVVHLSHKRHFLRSTSHDSLDSYVDHCNHFSVTIFHRCG